MASEEVADFAVRNTAIVDLERIFKAARQTEELMQAAANGTEQ